MLQDEFVSQKKYLSLDFKLEINHYLACLLVLATDLVSSIDLKSMQTELQSCSSRGLKKNYAVVSKKIKRIQLDGQAAEFKFEWLI